MNSAAILKIDAVDTAKQGACEGTDILEIEWFEVNKQLLKRSTVQGVFLQLDKKQQQKWQDGDRLWSQGNCLATIRIRPCLAILIHSNEVRVWSDFCYYIGNRHLPVFVVSERKALAVPYDGNLFEQLKAKFPESIALQELQLLEENRLQHRDS